MPLRMRLIHSGLMSLFLATFMTAWITFLNLGLNADYWVNWFRAFAFAWPAAFLIAFVVGPTVGKLAHKINAKFEAK